MRRLFLKKKLFRKIVIFIVASFILLNGSIIFCSSDLFAADTLRPAAKQRSHKSPQNIQEALQRAQAIGFLYKNNPDERAKQIRALFQEIDIELAQPGTGNLPNIVMISDFHGAADKVAALLSYALRELAGFKGELDYNVPLEEQLNRQGMSLKNLSFAVDLGGDIPDRGPYPLRTFFMVEELVNTAPDRVIFKSGNHDLYVPGNVSGLHLPWYKEFHFYGDKEAEELIAQKRRSNPEYFDDFNGFLWWTERLAGYNELQKAFQQEFLGGKAKEIRKKFIGFYDTYSPDWNGQQLDAMENFIGYFKRKDVPDPYVGLNDMGQTSAIKWKNAVEQLRKGRQDRKKSEAGSEELALWDEAVFLSGQISEEVGKRLNAAMQDGRWEYRIFESINNQAYESVEWWCKDWSSHKDWGEGLIRELNEMLKNPAVKNKYIESDRKEFAGEEVTQANYIRSHTLQAFAKFTKEHFRIYSRSIYYDLGTHSWFPVEDDSHIVIEYKGRTYTDNDIYGAFDLISDDARRAADVSAMWEPLDLVNSWYADKTTRVKPAFERKYEQEIGIAKIQKNIGAWRWFTGHNPTTKLKLPFMVQDGGYAHFHTDKGAAPRFGGEGSMVIAGPAGIRLFGFESNESGAEIIESPRTIIASKKVGEPAQIIENPPLPAKEFLLSTKSILAEELAILDSPLPDGGKNLKDLWGNFAPVAEEFFSDIDINSNMENLFLDAHTSDQIHPIVMNHEVLRSLPGIMLLQNFASYFGPGNIKLVVHIDADIVNIAGRDVKLNSTTLNRDGIADEIFAEINAIAIANKMSVLNRSMISAVVTGGNIAAVAEQIKIQVGTDKFQVIGDADYAGRFKDVANVRIVLDQADGQFAQWAKALKLAINLTATNGEMSAEDVKQLDAAFPKDSDGNYRVQATSLAADSEVATILSNFAAAVAAKINI